MPKHLLLSLIIMAAAARASTSVSTNRLEPLELYPRIAAQLVERLPNEHISQQQLDDTVSRRTWENYLRYLDSQRIYFLQEDIDAFRRHVTELDDAILAGDLTFAYDVYEIYRERVRDRVEQASGVRLRTEVHMVGERKREQ